MAVRKIHRARRGLVWLVVVPTAFAFIGCEGNSDLGQVTGKITMDGKPLVNALVEFVPTGNGSVSYGRTDSNGEYEMEFTRDTRGASLGGNQVRITTGDLVLNDEGREVAVPEKVPACYNGDNSELEVDVQTGANRFDFDLSSEGEIINAAEEDLEAET